VERRADDGWMNLTEAARAIGISARTLRLAVERGELAAEHPLSDGPWIFHRDALEGSNVAALVARARDRRRGSAIPAEEQGVLDLSMT
jgi:nitrogen fixation protein FixH